MVGTDATILIYSGYIDLVSSWDVVNFRTVKILYHIVSLFVVYSVPVLLSIQIHNSVFVSPLTL